MGDAIVEISEHTLEALRQDKETLARQRDEAATHAQELQDCLRNAAKKVAPAEGRLNAAHEEVTRLNAKLDRVHWVVDDDTEVEPRERCRRAERIIEGVETIPCEQCGYPCFDDDAFCPDCDDLLTMREWGRDVPLTEAAADWMRTHTKAGQERDVLEERV